MGDRPSLLIHGYQPTWFNRELKAITGVDVFGAPYAGQGYQIYNSRHFHVLVTRQEYLDVLPSALEALFGLKNVETISGNVSAEKLYSQNYADVKASIRLPSDVLDKLCSIP